MSTRTLSLVPLLFLSLFLFLIHCQSPPPLQDTDPPLVPSLFSKLVSHPYFHNTLRQSDHHLHRQLQFLLDPDFRPDIKPKSAFHEHLNTYNKHATRKFHHFKGLPRRYDLRPLTPQRLGVAYNVAGIFERGGPVKVGTTRMFILRRSPQRKNNVAVANNYQVQENLEQAV